MKRRTYPDLATFFSETGKTQAEAADALGLSQGYMSKIRNGLAEPPLRLAIRISRYARVPVESLVRPCEREPAQLRG